MDLLFFLESSHTKSVFNDSRYVLYNLISD